jgi:hypothetical protein
MSSSERRPKKHEQDHQADDHKGHDDIEGCRHPFIPKAELVPVAWPRTDMIIRIVPVAEPIPAAVPVRSYVGTLGGRPGSAGMLPGS